MKIKKKKGGGGANWQDTYGDMVTLLLCFFVLLFAISSVDQVKWENLVRSLNPDVEEVSQVVEKDVEPGDEAVPGSVQSDKKMEQLYEGLVEEMKKVGIEESVEITKGEGYNFISYKDNVFFDGDSPVLRKDGQKILDGFVRATKPKADVIDKIVVMAHTSQADPNKQNEIIGDRSLAAQRGANTIGYIQRKLGKSIDPANLSSQEYGQFHPIATFKTSAGRQKNRRVEILILGKGTAQKDLDAYYAEVYGKDAVKASGGGSNSDQKASKK